MSTAAGDGSDGGKRSGRIRAFVAVPVHGEAAERIGAISDRLRSRSEHAGWRARWVRPANLHLTLKFLGGVDPGRIEAIAGALEPLSAHPPFSVRFAGVGRFPPGGRPRVVWIGVDRGAETLQAIASEADERLQNLGFSPEGRPFRPHLTLARVKRAAGRPDDVLHPVRDADGGTMTVSELVLYQSRTLPDGPVYTRLASVALTG